MKNCKLLALLILILTACSHNANRPYTENEVIKIYVATEFSDENSATNMIKQYKLTDDSNRHKYYDTVRKLTDTPEKYNDFTKKIEQYKQDLFAQSSNAQTRSF